MPHPTILCYGQPSDAPELISELQALEWGYVIDNGYARDPIFTIYENVARADAIIALPSAHPVHLVTLLAEAEVGHPLIVQQTHSADPQGPTKDFKLKPIIFLGKPEEWAPFRELFSEMRAQGLLREGFDHAATYITSVGEALSFIDRALPSHLPLTRLHYYLHTRRSADLTLDQKPEVRPPGIVTVACFGSASTKDSRHLERTDQMAAILAKAGCNILHGGGTGGVMGRLSTCAARYKAFVYGITVHPSGAPKIFFERAAGDGRPEEIDFQIASKDMLHRIETYAGHSHAFVALDGGIGSVQEVLVMAELKVSQHPVTQYQSITGTRAPKPLYVLNEGGIYSGLLEYLESRSLLALRAQIEVFTGARELGEALAEHFGRFSPAATDPAATIGFRSQYAQTSLPMGMRAGVAS